MALTFKTADDLLEFLDIYWLNAKELSDEIFYKWDGLTPHDKIKYVTKMNNLCNRFAGLFYEWNMSNGWFLAQSVRFFKSAEELKKPEPSRHSKRYNMTYGERLEECLDDFQAQIGAMITVKEDIYEGFQINLLLKMKIVSNETIAIFDDIYMRFDWYDEGLLSMSERQNDGSKGGYKPAHKAIKAPFKP